jgi:hypothetical protein
VKVYACSSTSRPAGGLDCSQDKSDTIEIANAPAGGDNSFETDKDGNFSVTLAKPLIKDNFVWVTEVATLADGVNNKMENLDVAVAVTAPASPRILNTYRNPKDHSIQITGSVQANAPTIQAGAVTLCDLTPASGFSLVQVSQTFACATVPKVIVNPDGSFYPDLTSSPLSAGNYPVTVRADGSFSATLNSAQLAAGDYIGISQTVTPMGGVPVIKSIVPLQPTNYDGVCKYGFNDCDYIWTLLGGIEQADLSSQSSQTEGFIDMFVRAPWNMRWGSIWLRSRFMGAPASTNTLNVATAATNATGFTTAQLPQNVLAVDYNIGYQHDFLLPGNKNPGSAMFTWGPVISFGATTPLDASAPTLAYSVPNYGTNECTQLQARFGAPFTLSGASATAPVTLTGKPNPNGYSPYLPPPGYYNGTTIGCVVQPVPGSSGNVASVSQPGTQITTIAFSHEDRSSFLLKWQAGVRLINRWHSGASSVCSTWSPPNSGEHANDGRCSRMIADITFGQDQSITGGYLRHFVMKNDILLPIGTTGLYFFGAASTRFSRNTTYSPLILNSVPIASGTNPPAGSVTIPSPSVFVLPLKQPDRDYYRIGFGIDVTALIKPLVSK